VVTGGPGGALLAIATITVTISAWLRSKESHVAYTGFLLLIVALVVGAVLIALHRAASSTSERGNRAFSFHRLPGYRQGRTMSSGCQGA